MALLPYFRKCGNIARKTAFCPPTHFLNKIWRPNEQKFYEGSGLVTPSTPLVPASYLIYEYITVAGQKAKKPAKAKLSFCFKEKIRQTKIGKIRKKINDGWRRGVVNIHITHIYLHRKLPKVVCDS